MRMIPAYINEVISMRNMATTAFAVEDILKNGNIRAF